VRSGVGEMWGLDMPQLGWAYVSTESL